MTAISHRTLPLLLAAAAARRALKRLARPAGGFDARRYFRGTVDLRFHNVGTAAMRKLARSIHAEHAADWTVDDAVACADALIVDRYLEAKGVGIELLARYRRDFTPRLLPCGSAGSRAVMRPTGPRRTRSAGA